MGEGMEEGTGNPPMWLACWPHPGRQHRGSVFVSMTAKFRSSLVFTCLKFNFNCCGHYLALARGMAAQLPLSLACCPGAPGTEPCGQGGKYWPRRVIVRLGTVYVKWLLHRSCLIRGDTHIAKKIVKRWRRRVGKEPGDAGWCSNPGGLTPAPALARAPALHP